MKRNKPHQDGEHYDKGWEVSVLGKLIRIVRKPRGGKKPPHTKRGNEIVSLLITGASTLLSKLIFG